MIRFALALSLALAGAPTLTAAATVGVVYAQYGNTQSDINAALADRDAFMGGAGTAGEDFEGFTACPATGCASGTVATGVGSFVGVGGAFTGGGSQVSPTDQIVVRTGTPNPYGRFNVTQNGAKWLDSNDMGGIKWSVLLPGSGLVTKLAFLLTDIDDVNNVLFTITVNGTNLTTKVEARPGSANVLDGTLHLVTMTFSHPTDLLTIKMVNGLGDGFGVDGLRVAAIPLPAGGLLLLAGLGGLALLRRKRAA